MDAIELDAVIKDGHIIVDLPDDLPEGRVKLTIHSVPEIADDMTAAQADTLLRAAGLLVDIADLDIPDDIGEITEGELDQLIADIPPGTPVEDLLNEDRGEY